MQALSTSELCRESPTKSKIIILAMCIKSGISSVKTLTLKHLKIPPSYHPVFRPFVRLIVIDCEGRSAHNNFSLNNFIYTPNILLSHVSRCNSETVRWEEWSWWPLDPSSVCDWEPLWEGSWFVRFQSSYRRPPFWVRSCAVQVFSFHHSDLSQRGDIVIVTFEVSPSRSHPLCMDLSVSISQSG